MSLFNKIDTLLMDLRSEIEEKFERVKPGSPVYHRLKGKIEMLEEIEI